MSKYVGNVVQVVRGRYKAALGVVLGERDTHLSLWCNDPESKERRFFAANRLDVVVIGKAQLRPAAQGEQVRMLPQGFNQTPAQPEPEPQQKEAEPDVPPPPPPAEEPPKAEKPKAKKKGRPKKKDKEKEPEDVTQPLVRQLPSARQIHAQMAAERKLQQELDKYSR